MNTEGIMYGDYYYPGEELDKMASGGIPQRYKNMGFTKVGAKKKSTRPGKKWMVLAKKGDQYKVVHGGDSKMKDFKQHGSEKRKDRFWDRMGGRDSAKAKDPFSPLYWHKKFGTWEQGGQTFNENSQDFYRTGAQIPYAELGMGIDPPKWMKKLGKSISDQASDAWDATVDVVDDYGRQGLNYVNAAFDGDDDYWDNPNRTLASETKKVAADAWNTGVDAVFSPGQQRVMSNTANVVGDHLSDAANTTWDVAGYYLNKLWDGLNPDPIDFWDGVADVRDAIKPYKGWAQGREGLIPDTWTDGKPTMQAIDEKIGESVGVSPSTIDSLISPKNWVVPSGSYLQPLPIYDEHPNFNKAFAQARKDLGPGGYFLYRGQRHPTNHRGEAADQDTQDVLDLMKKDLSPEQYQYFIDTWEDINSPRLSLKRDDDKFKILPLPEASTISWESATNVLNPGSIDRNHVNILHPGNKVHVNPNDYGDTEGVAKGFLDEFGHSYQVNNQGTGPSLFRLMVDPLRPYPLGYSNSFYDPNATYHVPGTFEHEAHHTPKYSQYEANFPERKNDTPDEEKKRGGQMIKRADGSYSRRGLWDNIRANRGSGKKPTKEMLEQERKIKKNKNGGEPQNEGFQALPPYVQAKIMSNMMYGGDIYGMGGAPCYKCGGQYYKKGGMPKYQFAGSPGSVDNYMFNQDLMTDIEPVSDKIDLSYNTLPEGFNENLWNQWDQYNNMTDEEINLYNTNKRFRNNFDRNVKRGKMDFIPGASDEMITGKNWMASLHRPGEASGRLNPTFSTKQGNVSLLGNENSKFAPYIKAAKKAADVGIKFGSWLGKAGKERNAYNDIMRRSLSDNLYPSVPMGVTGAMGDWDIFGEFRPDETLASRTYRSEMGGEIEMTDDQIKQLVALGAEIEFLD